MSSTIVPLCNINSIAITREDYVVFGGTFDPIHQGHLQAIRELNYHFRQVVIAVTNHNPWKNIPSANLQERRQMAIIALKQEKLPIPQELHSPEIVMSDFDYKFAEELVTHLRNIKSGSLFWAVGEDIAESVSEWRNWDTLNVTTISVPIEIPVHAKQIRSGNTPLHPSLVNFARTHSLYGF